MTRQAGIERSPPPAPATSKENDMFDFSKLRRPSAAEQREQEQRRRAAAIEDDHTRRLLRSRDALRITLTDHPDARFTVSGACALHLYGDRPNGREVRAVWYAPDHMSRDEFDAIVARYAIGATLDLRGYWKAFEGNSGTSFTFIAQFVKVADRAEPVERKSPQAEIDAFDA
jgi:hypothetical protein